LRVIGHQQYNVPPSRNQAASPSIIVKQDVMRQIPWISG
jgi:hypothetical protein